MRPSTSAPAVELTVGGRPLASAVVAAVSTVRVARRLSLPAQCEVAFALEGAAGRELLGGLRLGERLEVSVAGDPGPLFAGAVTAHEWAYTADGAGELRVRAYDELHQLRCRRRVIARAEVSLADLLDELAGSMGLGADSGPAPSHLRWPLLVQRHESDLDLLRRVTEEAGLWFTVADGAIVLLSLDGLDGEPVPLMLRDNLLAASLEATADPATRAVLAHGWDPATATGLVGNAARARVGREVVIDPDPALVGGDGADVVVGVHGPSADHLEAAAQARLDRVVTREVVLRGTADGDARIRPGRRVLVQGVDAAVAGTYVLTETTHTVDADGYLVALSSTPPPAWSPTPRASEVTLGRVTTADDPAGLGRVRVALPGFGDIETDWRQVLSPGAGSGKGIVSLPDVDDRVLVLIPGGDPAAAVVLGGLYGDAGAFDAGLVGGAVRRWSLRTPGGQRVVLDDDAGTTLLADRDGSEILFEPGRVVVHAAGDLVLQAPGRTMTLRADRIEMLRATADEPSPSEVSASSVGSDGGSAS